MQAEFGDRGLRVVAVNGDNEDAGTVRAYVKDVGLSPPATVLLDGRGIRTRQYGGGFPSTYLIDREGRVRHVHNGWRQGDEDRLRKHIEELL